eukprot:9342592-Alexandrium_andersonii.AAC.1
MANAKHMQQRYYSDGPPDRFPHETAIGVADDHTNAKGAMKRVSPEEFAHAALLACSAALQAGLSDQDTRRWLHMFLKTPFAFQFLPND